MITCNKCLKEYDESSFYKGQGARCKNCAREHQVEYQKRAADVIAKNKRRYYEEVILQRRQKRREETKKERERIKEQRRKERAKLNAARKQEKEEEVKRKAREWARNNRSIVNARLKKRLAENINFRIATRMRTLIFVSLRKRGVCKSGKTNSLLGCTIPELRQHLESKFLPGMTWGNHSRNGWHIDHIRPCASFDLSDPEQQKTCFHYTNLQPLWAKDNMRKSNKINGVRVKKIIRETSPNKKYIRA
jgi:hypothetical protein